MSQLPGISAFAVALSLAAVVSGKENSNDNSSGILKKLLKKGEGIMLAGPSCESNRSVTDDVSGDTKCTHNALAKE